MKLVTVLLAVFLMLSPVYAEEDSGRWDKEFNETRSKKTHWPYTKEITYLGIVFRQLKVWAPVISSFLFIISLFLR